MSKEHINLSAEQLRENPRSNIDCFEALGIKRPKGRFRIEVDFYCGRKETWLVHPNGHHRCLISSEDLKK